MHLRQPGFMYSACRPFTKTKKEYKNLHKQEIRGIFIKTNQTCFIHDMAYRDFKYLSRRTTSYKVLHDKASSLAKNPKYDRYQRRIASVVYRFFDKKC